MVCAPAQNLVSLYAVHRVCCVRLRGLRGLHWCCNQLMFIDGCPWFWPQTIICNLGGLTTNAWAPGWCAQWSAPLTWRALRATMPHSLHNPRGSSAARGLSVCRPDATCVLLCTVCVAFFFGWALGGPPVGRQGPDCARRVGCFKNICCFISCGCL